MRDHTMKDSSSSLFDSHVAMESETNKNCRQNILDFWRMAQKSTAICTLIKETREMTVPPIWTVQTL
jgi:hypothetical protein